jgi:predicted peptidase
VKLICLILGCSIWVACSMHGPSYSETEFPARAVNVNGVSYQYRIYVPKGRGESGQKVPVMLYLHGSNRRGTDNEAQLADLYENIKGFPDNWQFIVVIPQCREDTFWAGPMTEQAMAALDQTVKEFNGDENRLYLAGYSMGGFGVWQTAITFPNKFAALVPIAGGIEPVGKVSDKDRAILSAQVTAAADSPNPYAAFAERLKQIPVWIVHGSTDEAVPVEGARKIAAALKAAGNQDVNYIELEGVGHGSIVPAFSDPHLFEWLTNRQLRK